MKMWSSRGDRSWTQWEIGREYSGVGNDPDDETVIEQCGCVEQHGGECQELNPLGARVGGVQRVRRG